jgi:hypothetical protein
MKHLYSTNKFQPRWEWVGGLTVKRKRWYNSTLAEQLNHQLDILAKDSLLSPIAGGLLMEGDFPFEPTRFKLSEKSVYITSTVLREGLGLPDCTVTVRQKRYYTKRGFTSGLVGWT